ncbi:MAG: flagellar biosynthesis protein FlaG [Epsilonproteobacteria bacterium]|jgi:flagellar protein FlaG|uniref:Flagellar biosynthesis protein FlaG n=1 Tax=Sulfurospirillum cavolei TaxID=366522 RepID=A0A2D3WH85_9BACT|nr:MULTISPECIES: FlaG family protein [Sulfurospirillum]NCB54434.1 flagellar biosynthesis protein FlaG [Campylobacterota bacterium]DAB37074.1 MAG TPA: flagellar biosynthesis protein FlaG [Sulfurospirillum cavolei]KHG33591.1 MAG: flagellar protein FlaG [Sulfurospirillum sp. MES]MCP3651328.1 FlaG family protein [Sulfurospirillum sp. DNRA8]MCR1810175.1 FlaG family protein [Sulfurospirillum sp. DNRA8]
MDIFSATSKHVEATTTPKSANVMPTKQVEHYSETTDANPDNQKDQTKDVKASLEKTVKELNEQMDMLDTNLKFGFNDKIDIMYVNVMEKSTGKLIRKFPTEEAMNLSAKMKEIVGMIFDKKG